MNNQNITLVISDPFTRSDTGVTPQEAMTLEGLLILGAGAAVLTGVVVVK